MPSARTVKVEPPAWLTHICGRFGLNPQDLNWIASSQNHVWSCELADEQLLLRVSVDRGRTLADIEAELGWLQELAECGIPVARPLPSPAGSWCERVVDQGAEYFGVTFQKAPGRKVEAADLNRGLYQQLGELTGQLHAASWETLPPASERFHRSVWTQSRLLTTDVDRYVPAHETRFRSALQQLVASLETQVANRLGLVHADISFSNTFLDGSKLTIFDFDNCEMGSVEQDLATVWYDSVYCRLLNRVSPERLPVEIYEHWNAFLSGYCKQRPEISIDPGLIEKFIILREAIIYVHYHRTLDPASMTDRWRDGMAEMRSHVEQGQTPIPWKPA